MFQITHCVDALSFGKKVVGRGIHIKFENGVTASIQFGKSNYCSSEVSSEYPMFGYKAETCEIACWDENNKDLLENYIDCGYDKSVKGHVNADEIPAFLVWCKSL